MNNESIEALATEFSQAYNPTGLVPFPFESAASTIGNVDILYLDQLGVEVSGVIFWQDERFKIIINRNKPVVRQYFTLAHEFGHLLLHKDWLVAHPNSGFIDHSANFDNLAALMRPDIPPLDPDQLKREKEANNFAAIILMPASKVAEFWNLTHDVTECARAFQVSTSAMAIRLERLGLVN